MIDSFEKFKCYITRVVKVFKCEIIDKEYQKYIIIVECMEEFSYVLKAAEILISLDTQKLNRDIDISVSSSSLLIPSTVIDVELIYKSDISNSSPTFYWKMLATVTIVDSFTNMLINFNLQFER